MDSVIPLSGGQFVGAGGATQHNMFNAAVSDRAIGQAGEQGRLAVGGERIIEDRPGAANAAGLEVVGGAGEDVARQVNCRGVARHDVAEGLLLQLGEHVQAGGAGEVVQPVVVLQMQHLCAEHVGEAGAEHAAEGLQLFCQASDPEVHVLQAPEGAAGVDAGGVEEVLGIEVAGGGTADQGGGGGAASRVGGGGQDRGVAAVGGDEVGERLDVLDVQAEVAPAGVGLKGGVAGVGEELFTGSVQAGYAGVSAAGQVEGTQIKGETHQPVA